MIRPLTLARLLFVVLPAAAAACSSSEPTAPTAPISTAQVAAKLTFMVQPGDAMAYAALSPAVAVAIQDSSGKIVTTATSAVKLALAGTSEGGTLSGVTTVNAVDGMATFLNLSIRKPGTGYTLTASSGSLKGATSAPFNIDTVVGFAMLNAGVVTSCGLTTGGVAYCWGTNDLGRLGDGTTQDHLLPVPVFGGLRFTTLSAASLQTCGLTTAGAAYCWGSNEFGSLGTGTMSAPQMCYSSDWADEGIGNQPCSPSPLPVSGGLSFVALSTGGSSTTCALTTDGTAYCWGYGREGELGSGTTTGCCSPVPVLVSGGLHFAAVSPGGFHTCGLTTQGVVYCWGWNYYGELGNGTTTSSNVPVPVSGGLHFATVGVGAYHTCGLTTEGVAYCWGWNNYGQIGDGTTTSSNVPVPVSGGRRFTALSTLSWHNCALTTSGEAYCWGQNFDGQLGDGTTANRNVPVLVSGGLRFLAVSSGHRHTCGITTDGAYCWGANDYGQFGDGTTTSSNVPVRAAGAP